MAQSRKVTIGGLCVVIKVRILKNGIWDLYIYGQGFIGVCNRVCL